jgi:hypothetical protein
MTQMAKQQQCALGSLHEFPGILSRVLEYWWGCANYNIRLAQGGDSMVFSCDLPCLVLEVKSIGTSLGACNEADTTSAGPPVELGVS